MSNPVLFLIDGHAQIYRAYYAMESLKSRGGEASGAAFGFTRLLTDLLDNQAPAGIAAVFDSPGKTFRHDNYPDYKANRKPPPPELVEQIPLVMDIVRGYRVPVYALPGYEADDILGTLTRQAGSAGWDVVLVTGDKDCGQLLRPGVRIYDPAKDSYTDSDSFTEKKGLPPDKLVDLMGLWGDTADNIPGVPGIGEKIGVQLIQQYGSLENLLAHADEVKGKRGEVLRANREQAVLSKQLATIDVNVPVTLDLDAARPCPPDTDALRALFTRLDFRSFLARLDAASGQSGRPREAEEVTYTLIQDEAAFASFFAEFSRQTFFAVDTETMGLDPLRDDLVGLCVSWAERTGYYLPFHGPAGAAVLPLSCLAKMKPIFENPAISKTGHNLRFDALVLRRAGIHLEGADFDTLIASSLIDGHLAEHGLKTLARRVLDVEMTPIQDLIGSGKGQSTIDLVPLADAARYGCADADMSLRLHNRLAPRLDERGVRKLFTEVEMPLSGVLTDMQAVGVRLDAALLERESSETAGLLESLTREIHDLAGHAFNVASPKQLAAVLFEEQGLPVIRKTQTGASTDESVLQELAALHNSELADRVLEYRMYAKLKNTYLDALPKMVNPATGRLHTSYSQVRTATGRLASSNPNLQNIPVRTERGRAVRAAFVPEAGWRLLAADYSQVELRVLAAFCADPTLARAFADDMDIHRVVAAEINGIAPDAVTKDQRSAAKAVNFGIIYGQSAHGLSAATGLSRAQAQRFIDDYFARFPGVAKWIDGALARARADGSVSTLLGLRRAIPDINSTNHMRRARAEREAVNTIIQGSAADLIKTAMVALHRAMRTAGVRSRLLLQIHDELVLECPPEEVSSVRELVRGSMENALPLGVPLKVDIGTGDNWLECK